MWTLSIHAIYEKGNSLATDGFILIESDLIKIAPTILLWAAEKNVPYVATAAVKVQEIGNLLYKVALYTH